MRPTRRCWHIYEVLCCWQACRPYPPTLQELATACGQKSRGSMHWWVGKLRRAGLVVQEHGKVRTIRTTGWQA